MLAATIAGPRHMATKTAAIPAADAIAAFESERAALRHFERELAQTQQRIAELVAQVQHAQSPIPDAPTAAGLTQVIIQRRATAIDDHAERRMRAEAAANELAEERRRATVFEGACQTQRERVELARSRACDAWIAEHTEVEVLRSELHAAAAGLAAVFDKEDGLLAECRRAGLSGWDTARGPVSGILSRGMVYPADLRRALAALDRSAP